MISSLLQRVVRSRLSKKIIPWYAGYYGVDLTQLDRPISQFSHLESFFTRQLVPGSRPFSDSPEVVVSPVDGRLSVVTSIDERDEFLVKGKSYQLSQLLGSKELAEDYYGGSLLILYLSPADYHRIHLPLAARDIQTYNLGKFSWPVNDWGLKWTRGLTSNYRLISRFESEFGPFLMVSVGALNVNSIVKHHPEGTSYQKMQEYGYFSFGSTVILVFPKNRLVIHSTTERSLKAGETLGKLIL